MIDDRMLRFRKRGEVQENLVEKTTNRGLDRIPIQTIQFEAFKERFEFLNKRFMLLEESLELRKETTRGQLQDIIYERLYDFLLQNYPEKYVALTYSGKIIASEDTDVKLLNHLKQIKYSPEQFFIHKVMPRNTSDK